MPARTLITRTHRDAGIRSEATYSDCERYRYSLTRVWAPDLPRLAFVMLNPSTATEVRNDATIARCVARARALGFGSVRITNLFAWRATDPGALRGAADPVGPGNDAAIRAAALWADTVLAAWGVHGALHGRGEAVAGLLRASGRPLVHLGITQGGSPRHPLYVANARQPEPWH